MQPAQLLVEIDQTRGQTRQLAVPAERRGRHLHRALEGVGEGLEAGGRRAVLGQGVEPLLGAFDLVAGVVLHVRGGGDGDVPADADQLPAHGQVIDHPGIVRGVGRRRRSAHQVGEIAQSAHLLEGRVAAEALLQDDRLGQLALADIFLHGAEQPLVERFVEVGRVQLVDQPLIGGVVVQDAAQQRLLRLEIAGRVGRGQVHRVGRLQGAGEGGHVIFHTPFDDAGSVRPTNGSQIIPSLGTSPGDARPRPAGLSTGQEGRSP